jgi:hypothetical protein
MDPGGEVELTGQVRGKEELVVLDVLAMTICLSGGVTDV